MAKGKPAPVAPKLTMSAVLARSPIFEEMLNDNDEERLVSCHI